MDPTYYILTVHVTDKWIDIQKRYLDRFCSELKTKTIAVVPDLGRGDFDEEWAAYEDCDWSKNHQKNLGLLTKKMLHQANDDDVMVVLDGDAFPISALAKIVSPLKTHPIVSVSVPGTDTSSLNVRLKFDRYMACYFMAMRVGFWKELKAGWGPSSFDRGCGDTNGKLIEIVYKRRIRWFPLERTNAIEPLYPWFGIYGNAIYHQGSGFHSPNSLLPMERKKIKCLYGIGPYEWRGKKRHLWEKGSEEYVRWKKRLWDLMYERIRTDFHFYELFLSP